jgi:hypothetical protein
MSEAHVRAATPADVESIFAVKRDLMIAPGAPAMARGGFLLGSSREQYAFFIRHANVLVLEAKGRVQGFAVTLPDEILRQSDLWMRREQIDWQESLGSSPEDAALFADLLTGRIGYFEQLALLPFAPLRIYAPAFALCAALELLRSGHRHIFTTVVAGPLPNPAPLPLLRIIGARRLGRISEAYPEIGAIQSDVYHLDTARWNFGVGPESPLFTLRERIARMVRSLRGDDELV